MVQFNKFILVFMVIFLYGFLFNKKFLYYSCIFFSPYTAMSLINLNGFSLSVAQVGSLLFILRYSMEIIIKKKIILKNKLLIYFLVLCIISLLSPFYISSELFIWKQKGGFSQYNIIKNELLKDNCYQILYLNFSIIIYILSQNFFLKELNGNLKKIMKIIEYSFYSIVFTVIIEVVCKQVNKVEIFNNIFRMNDSTLNQGLRVSGPNLEPSMFAIYLIFMLGIFFYNKQFKQLLLVIVLGVMTTSSSFILGFIFFLCSAFRQITYREKRKIFLLLVFMIIFLFFYMSLDPVVEAQIKLIISKLQGKGTSGSERSLLMKTHLRIFLEAPILGIGYGSARSTDLLTTWLANIGSLGIVVFLGALFKNFKLKWKKILIILFIIELISVPEPYFLYIWYFWGVIEGKSKV